MTDVIVVIGSGAIGQAIARRVSAGKQVLLADLQSDNAQNVAKVMGEAGFDVRPTTVDVGSRESVEALVREAAGLGEITGIIHSAGVSPSNASPAMIFKVDLYGTAIVLEAFGHVIARGGSGVVVSSQAGHRLGALTPEQTSALATTPADELLDLAMLQPDRVTDSLVAYQIAKRGSSLRVKAEAPRWARRGARVNAISPGIVVTPLSRKELSGPNSEGYQRMIEVCAAGRAGTPDEVGAVGALLMGQEGAFISGSDFLMDGGVTAAYWYGDLAPEKQNVEQSRGGAGYVSMKPLSSMSFALFGAALVAISYGLARFAFGLFVPPIRTELELTPYVIGIIGALPLISFLLATVIAPLAADRLGARNTAVVSGGFGVIGLGLISQSSGALSLGLGVFACGVCTGLMMPALTAAMQALVKRRIHGRVSSVMNAGTSIGVAVAVPAVLLLADAWRFAYLSFAVLAVAGVVAAWFLLPSVSSIMPANAAPPPPISKLQWSRLSGLSLFAFVMGFVSSAYWIFAPDLVVTLGALPPGATGWLWLAVGIAGLGGAVVADLADRNNPPITHALMLMMMSASLALLAASPGQLVLATFSALVFGLSYMSLTGLYLMTGIRLLPGRLSMGPVLPFMACALGQAAGSPVVGILVDDFGYADAFAMFSAIGIVAAILSPLYPRYIDQGPEEEEDEDETGLQAAFDHQLQGEDGEPFTFAGKN